MNKFLLIIAFILAGGGLLSVLAGAIIQSVVMWQTYGVLLSSMVYIPHWSLWLYCGFIPMIIGLVLIHIWTRE